MGNALTDAMDYFHSWSPGPARLHFVATGGANPSSGHRARGRRRNRAQRPIARPHD